MFFRLLQRKFDKWNLIWYKEIGKLFSRSGFLYSIDKNTALFAIAIGCVIPTMIEMKSWKARLLNPSNITNNIRYFCCRILFGSPVKWRFVECSSIPMARTIQGRSNSNIRVLVTNRSKSVARGRVVGRVIRHFEKYHRPAVKYIQFQFSFWSYFISNKILRTINFNKFLQKQKKQKINDRERENARAQETKIKIRLGKVTFALQWNSLLDVERGNLCKNYSCFGLWLMRTNYENAYNFFKVRWINWVCCFYHFCLV